MWRFFRNAKVDGLKFRSCDKVLRWSITCWHYDVSYCYLRKRSLSVATRRLVVEHLGFDVRVAAGVMELPDPEKMHLAPAFILCHSLTEGEQFEAVEKIRSHWPDARILVLRADDNDPAIPGCDTMSAFEGPAVLIEKTERLLRQSTMAKTGPFAVSRPIKSCEARCPLKRPRP